MEALTLRARKSCPPFCGNGGSVRIRTLRPMDEPRRESKVSALRYHRGMRATTLALLTAMAFAAVPHAQTPAEPDWKTVEAETLRHFQSLVQFDTSDPPGNEKPAADYLKGV